MLNSSWASFSQMRFSDYGSNRWSPFHRLRSPFYGCLFASIGTHPHGRWGVGRCPVAAVVNPAVQFLFCKLLIAQISPRLPPMLQGVGTAPVGGRHSIENIVSASSRMRSPCSSNRYSLRLVAPSAVFIQRTDGTHDMEVGIERFPLADVAKSTTMPRLQNCPIKIALQARCSPAWKTRSAKQCQSCMQAALSFLVPLSPPHSIAFPDYRKRVGH